MTQKSAPLVAKLIWPMQTSSMLNVKAIDVVNSSISMENFKIVDKTIYVEDIKYWLSHINTTPTPTVLIQSCRPASSSSIMAYSAVPLCFSSHSRTNERTSLFVVFFDVLKMQIAAVAREQRFRGRKKNAFQIQIIQQKRH